MASRLPSRPRTAAAAAVSIDRITTTFAALMKAEEALARLRAAKLPLQVAYHIAKLGRLAAAETAHFKAQRTEWIHELGVSRESTAAEIKAGLTNIVEVTPANWPEYEKRVNELGNAVVELAWRPLDVAALGQIELSADDLDALEPLLTGEPRSSAPA